MAFAGWQGPGGEGGSPPGGGGSSGGGSSGGGGGGGAHGNFDHNDQMLKAFFGYDPAANDYTQEVPGAWEARQEYTTGPWLDADRMFGAFVVANMNDSDSDQIVDYKDPSVVGNGRAAEPDLIKLVITIPDWGPQYECSVEGFHTDFVTNTTTSTQAIRFFGSNTKGSLNGMAGITPWSGEPVDSQNPNYTPAKGFNITQAGTYTVYAEVHAASLHICDYDIIVELRTPESTTSNGQYDQANVTAIWATSSMTVERNYFTVANIVGDQFYLAKHNPDPNAPALEVADLPEVGDMVTIYDDNFDNNESPYNVANSNYVSDHSIGHARYWIFAEITEKGSDTVGVYIKLKNSVGIPLSEPDILFGIISDGDRLGYSLSKHAKSNTIRPLSELMGGKIGSILDRFGPTWFNGMECQFKCQPTGIVQKKLSTGINASFDIARQAHGILLDSQGNIVEEFSRQYPRDENSMALLDELPNDSKENDDQDCSFTRETDVCISIDMPGAGTVRLDYPQPMRFLWDQTWNVGKQYFEFREFIRVDLTGKPVTTFEPATENSPEKPATPGNEIWGSRCSNHKTWFSNMEVQHDADRPIGATFDGLFYGMGTGNPDRNQIGVGDNPLFTEDWPYPGEN